MLDLMKQCNEWKEKYGDVVSIESADFEVIPQEEGRWTMGRCWYYKDKNDQAWFRYYARIQVDAGFKFTTIQAKAILWHEYCHAVCWCEDGVNDDHNWYFQKKKLRKPFLTLVDVALKFIGWVWDE